MRSSTILLALGLALVTHLEAASSQPNVGAALSVREEQQEAEEVAPTVEMIDLKDIGEPLSRLTNKMVILDRNVRGMVPRRSLDSVRAFCVALAEINHCIVETSKVVKITKIRSPVHGNLRTYAGSLEPQPDEVPLKSLFSLPLNFISYRRYNVVFPQDHIATIIAIIAGGCRSNSINGISRDHDTCPVCRKEVSESNNN